MWVNHMQTLSCNAHFLFMGYLLHLQLGFQQKVVALLKTRVQCMGLKQYAHSKVHEEWWALEQG
jgi:hypothetical protein